MHEEFTLRCDHKQFISSQAVKLVCKNGKTIMVVKFKQQFFAYLNECQHLPVELDWEEGKFFDSDNQYIICSTHGALYDPQTGHCISGPCKSKYLHKLDVIQLKDQIRIIYDGS